MEVSREIVGEIWAELLWLEVKPESMERYGKVMGRVHSLIINDIKDSKDLSGLNDYLGAMNRAVKEIATTLDTIKVEKKDES